MSRSTKICGSLEKILVWYLLIALFPFISTQSPSDGFNEKMKQAKAKLLQTIQKESFELGGFDEFATVPITFPIDICLMEVANHLYAACLSLEYYGGKNVTVLSVLAHGPKNPENPLYDYELIFKYETRSAQSMDCVSMGTDGYIAVVNSISPLAYNDINQGSPIFQLKNNQVTPVQFFAQPGQVRVQLLNVHNTMFMIQTFRSGANNEKSLCPILKWIDSTFNVFDYLPCMNAARIEPFIIDHHIYIAVANHMDQYQNVETYSTIYRYDMDVHKFNQTQKIKTFGAIDVKHFQITNNAISEHFLIFANLFDANKQKDSSIASNGVIYRYEHGKFAPIQILNFETDIQQFLPVLTENKEFVLLVSMNGDTMKTYQFDGWRFTETAISFSGGAFGKGISTMRTFNIKKKYTIVVVANIGMYKDAVNLFRPKFIVKMDYDFAKAFEMFDAWYKTAKDKLHSDGIVELFEQVESLRVPNGFDVVHLENVNVNKIEADTLTGASLPIDVKKFKRVVQGADELVAKEFVRRPKRLNDSFDPNVTDVLNVPLSLSANEITIGDSLVVKSVNSHRIDTLLRSHANIELNKMVVENLVIANDTANFLTIEAKLNATQARHKREAPPNHVKAEHAVDLGNVIVDGLVNGIKIEYLFENALLKNAPMQRIEADIKCGELNVTTVTIPSNRISNVNVATFARISGDHVAVYPPIQFAQRLDVDKFDVLHRVNQILIRNKKMDVLFKRFGKHTQVITGQKVFQSVMLREPISLQGSIKVSSPILNRIKPIATINDDLMIDGAVTFNGNTTILNALSAQNIFAPSLHFSVDQLHSDGLRTTDQLIDVPIVFVQPIRTNDVRSKTRLNTILIDDLVKRDPNATQIIVGRKTFTSDLSLGNGFSEVSQINGVKLQQLNETMLKKSSNMQAFNGTIAFKRIVIDRINVDKFIVGKTPLQQLLTRSTEQTINGTVTVHGNVFVSNGSSVSFNHLSLHNRIFDINLQDFLDDCYIRGQNESIHIETDKWFGNLTVGELIVENDFWHQNATIEEIHSRVERLSKSITQTGPLTFSNRFEIDDLIVNGMINGIPSFEFFTRWLLAAGDQVFSAPQNFENMDFSSNLNVNGLINGVDFNHLVSQSIPRSFNETIHLNHVVFGKFARQMCFELLMASTVEVLPNSNIELLYPFFVYPENVTFESPIELDGKLSGIQMPDDLILSESNALQNFIEPIILAGNVTIRGTLTISELLNNRDFSHMCGLLQPNQPSDYRLHVEGNMNFLKEPNPMNLNGNHFGQLIQTSWFLDDRTIEFMYATHFENVVWHNAITLTGRVNNIHLENISAKYLSLTKPQQITAPITFKGAVHFTDTVNVNAIMLDGLLKEYGSGVTMNITNFYANVLKQTDEIQFVRAPWTINELRSLGNIKVNTLNNLNLASDVVRWDRLNANIIQAEKSFGAIDIERLYCEANCLLQGVDVAKWIATSVLNAFDYSINGKIHLHNAIILNLIAVGPVNGVKFNSKTVLLSNVRQRIDGSVTIGRPDQIDMLTPLTFNNLNVGSINGRNFSEFHTNLITRNHRNRIAADIFTDIQMSNTLTIDNLNNLILQNSSNAMPSENFKQDAQDVFRMASEEPDNHVEKFADKRFHRMVIRDTYPANISRIFKIAEHNDQTVFITFYEKNIQLFTWHSTLMILQRNTNVSLTLPNSINVIELTVLDIDAVALLAIQMHNPIDGYYIHEFYHYNNDTQQMIRVHSEQQSQWTALKTFKRSHQPHHCYVLYRPLTPDYEVSCIENGVDSMEIRRIGSEHADAPIVDLSGNYEDLLFLHLSNNMVDGYLFEPAVTRLAQKQYGNVSSLVVKQFERFGFIGVISHEQSLNATRLHLYKLMDRELFDVPTIELPFTPIIQCEFTELSTDQYVLIVATGSGISLFEYKYNNGFQPMAIHQVNYNTFQPISFETSGRPKLISLIESERNLLEFIVVHMPDAMTLIECIYF